MSVFLHLLAVFGLSMLPVFELRGAIPYGFAMGLDWWQVMAVSVIGNLIPVPFIILFSRKAFDWLRDKRVVGRYIRFLESKVRRSADKVLAHSLMWVGLFVLVAIPLPGTGAWTGSFVAALIDLRLRSAMPAIALGVLVAGIIVSAMTYGVSAIFG